MVIRNAIDAYGEVGIYYEPGGFTVVTRVEQLGGDGLPLTNDYRWRKERPRISPLDPLRYLMGLSFAKPGEFRLIAIVVSTELIPSFGAEKWSEERARSIFAGGARQLPPDFHNTSYHGHFCHVLVYKYLKPEGQIAQLEPPSASASNRDFVRTVLQDAGIMQKLPR